MPRPPRRDAPGTVHHVIARGIDGREIFADDADRSELLERIDRVFQESGVRCLARAFLPNHLHAVVRTGPVALWRAMHRIHTGYARYFNARHDRRGYVFQGRFRSWPVDDDAYLVAAVRYVLLNPLRHGILPSLAALERDPWCSLSVLVGSRPGLAIDDVESVLGLVDGRPGRARRRLRAWLEEGLERLAKELENDPAPWRGASSPAMGDACPPVTPESAARPTAAHSSAPRRDPALFPSPTFDTSDPGPGDLAELAAHVCSELGVTPAQLCSESRARHLSAARAILAYRAVCEFGFPVAQVARLLRRTSSAVSQSARRGWALAGADAQRTRRGA